MADSENCQDSEYELCGVIVHVGRGCQFGHYYSYVKTMNGIWCRADDQHVSQVEIDEVLKQKAYLLFYVKKNSSN
jgi:ubiquitin carboxyl-terminal hydrolase 36/42